MELGTWRGWLQGAFYELVGEGGQRLGFDMDKVGEG